MPKLYLLGGENVYKRTAMEVNQRAFQDAGEPLAIVVFPWARASFDQMYRRRKVLYDYFISLGAGAVNFIEYSDPKEAIAQKIDSSGLIYLTGGLVSALVERLERMEIDSLLRDYLGVIVGRSAGALALCKKCVVTCLRSGNLQIFNGLGLANITLKAHYKPAKDDALLALSKGETIYAVPSRSALIYQNGTCSFMGEVYKFQNGDKTRL